MEELVGGGDKEKLNRPVEEGEENFMKLPNNSSKKKNGSTLLYFKIFFFAALMGGLALGGFWGYTKIREGMTATSAIIDINEKISRMESSQKAIHKKLDDLISEVDRVAKSGRIIAEIPRSLSVLEKRIDALDQSLSRIPQGATMAPEGMKPEESKNAVIPTPEAVELNKAESPPELYKEAPSSPEDRSMGKENGDLGSFMKTLMQNGKRALSWTWIKLKWLYHEIADAYSK